MTSSSIQEKAPEPKEIEEGASIESAQTGALEAAAIMGVHQAGLDEHAERAGTNPELDLDGFNIPSTQPGSLGRSLQGATSGDGEAGAGAVGPTIIGGRAVGAGSAHESFDIPSTHPGSFGRTLQGATSDDREAGAAGIGTRGVGAEGVGSGSGSGSPGEPPDTSDSRTDTPQPEFRAQQQSAIEAAAAGAIHAAAAAGLKKDDEFK